MEVELSTEENLDVLEFFKEFFKKGMGAGYKLAMLLTERMWQFLMMESESSLPLL